MDLACLQAEDECLFFVLQKGTEYIFILNQFLLVTVALQCCISFYCTAK